MFNEVNTSENKVCELQGRQEMLRDLLHELELRGRKTFTFDELVKRYEVASIEYEIAWNEWADLAKIGGGRYDCKGKGDKRGEI